VIPTPLFKLDNDRYSILREVGSGGFGVVYEGFDNDQGEQVAVKIFLPHVVVDDVVREATNQARLRDHAHIVDLRNVRVLPPRSFMVMEFLPDGSVKDRHASGRANLIEIVRWIRNGLDGLSYAHTQGIIHRDFKPANLMLTPNGTAKLSDFGIAEDTIKGQVVRQLYGALWAPELLQGGSSSIQTDIWAVGCTLYYLLTGNYPFGSPVNTADVLAGNFAPIHDTNPQVPMSVVRVIDRALAVDIAARYPNAWAMLSDLLACSVHRAWRPVADPTAIESWETCDNGPLLNGTVMARSRGGFDVVVKRQTPSGWRAIPSRRRVQTEAMARRKLHDLLRRHVQTAPK